MTSQVLFSKIHCTLSVNQLSVRILFLALRLNICLNEFGHYRYILHSDLTHFKWREESHS